MRELSPKELARKAFNAGRKRGRDEIRGSALTYEDERSEPSFERWWKEQTSELEPPNFTR